MASAQDLWQSIRREAEAAASRDHILGNSLQKSILDHPDFGSALALQIGERLGARDEGRTAFTRVAAEAFAAAPDLVEAAGRDLQSI
ncbi:MAG: serine acetyltransferase, partial [Bradyrhizobium sp.]